MKSSIIRLLLCLIIFPTGLFAQIVDDAQTFYISPGGNDKAKGSVEAPFASVQRALDEVNIIRKSYSTQAIMILLRQGTYYLKKPLVITSELASKNKTPLIITSFYKEKVILSGGEKLNLKWEPYKDGILKAKLAPGKSFDQLFVNGKQQILA